MLKGNNFCYFLFVVLPPPPTPPPPHPAPSEESSTLKGKNLLPKEANSFLLEQKHFQMGDKTILTDLPALKVIPLPIRVNAV